MKIHPNYIAGIIFIIGGIVSSFIYFYESPEKCFVENMLNWAKEENLSSDVESITRENYKMAVSRARAILQEYRVQDLNDDARKIYTQTKTLFDYCGLRE